MKKYSLSIALVCIAMTCFLSTGYSQIAFKPGIGINVTDWSKNPESTTTSGKVGWQIGASIAFGEKLYFEPGLFYQEKSTEVKVLNSESPTTFKFDNKISSLRIPVNIGYSIIGQEDGMFSLHIFGGPTASYVINVKESQFLPKDDYKDVNWGLQAGAGINLAILYLDISYEWGLNEFLKNANEKVKLQGFYMTAGLKF